MELKDLYAFLELQDKNRLDVSDRIKFLHNQDTFEMSHLDLENNKLFFGAKLFTNVANINSKDNLLTEINAPFAQSIEAGVAHTIRKINAPECTSLSIENNNFLEEESNINVAEDCKISITTEEEYYTMDDEEQYLLYQDAQDMRDFLSELKEREAKEAKEAQEVKEEFNTIDYEKKLSELIEKKRQVEKLEKELEKLKEEKQKNIAEKDDIKGSIILVSGDMYNERNFIDIGVAGQGLFSSFEKEIDLYRGALFKNEILCTKEELNKVIENSKDEKEIADFIYDKIKNKNYNWGASIDRNINKINELAKRLKETTPSIKEEVKKENEPIYAYVKKENGDIVDIPKAIRDGEVTVFKSEEKGTLVTNAKKVFMEDNKFTSIEAPNAELIKNIWETKSPLLEEINAPNCTYSRFNGCDILLDDNKIKMAENSELVTVVGGTYFSTAKEINREVLSESEKFYNTKITLAFFPFAETVKIAHLNDLEEIHAPKAEKIECWSTTELETIYAPECKELFCMDCRELKKENMELSYDCQIEGLEKQHQLKR